eukprot:1383816-Prymnesium_polylepis.1
MAHAVAQEVTRRADCRQNGGAEPYAAAAQQPVPRVAGRAGALADRLETLEDGRVEWLPAASRRAARPLVERGQEARREQRARLLERDDPREVA